MKKRRILMISWILMVLVLSKQVLAQEGENIVKPRLVESKTYRNWIECNGVKVPVNETPDFQQEDIGAYKSAFDEIIFVIENKPIYCVEAGFGWKLEGFTYGIRENSDKKILLFKISGEDSERYFDVRRKKEVYRLSGRGELIVSDTASVELGKVIQVQQEWQGSHSNVDKAEYLRITSDIEWSNLWQKHGKPDEIPPKVDFNEQMVIAILMGRTVNASGVRVVDVREIDNIIRFRFDANTYQTIGKFHNVTPFGFFVIPRIQKKIILEENVQGLIGGPPRWKLRAEFDKF